MAIYTGDLYTEDRTQRRRQLLESQYGGREGFVKSRGGFTRPGGEEVFTAPPSQQEQEAMTAIDIAEDNALNKGHDPQVVKRIMDNVRQKLTGMSAGARQRDQTIKLYRRLIFDENYNPGTITKLTDEYLPKYYNLFMARSGLRLPEYEYPEASEPVMAGSPFYKRTEGDAIRISNVGTRLKPEEGGGIAKLEAALRNIGNKLEEERARKMKLEELKASKSVGEGTKLIGIGEEPLAEGAPKTKEGINFVKLQKDVTEATKGYALFNQKQEKAAKAGKPFLVDNITAELMGIPANMEMSPEDAEKVKMAYLHQRAEAVRALVENAKQQGRTDIIDMVLRDAGTGKNADSDLVSYILNLLLSPEDQERMKGGEIKFEGGKWKIAKGDKTLTITQDK